jgi:LuxR family maltose regulon positive regulatory protein
MTELLATKLYIPRRRSNLVSRPRLTERLNAGLDRKLTLIATPAGFGKTTLLSEWIPQSPHCVTWFSLDQDDNDPTRFWAYMIASLQKIHPALGLGALTLLQSTQAPPINSILTSLINDITAFPDSFSAVLDDYQVIEFQPIHEALTFLIDHLPANMHLVITTRADPPYRWRPSPRPADRTATTALTADDCRISPSGDGLDLSARSCQPGTPRADRRTANAASMHVNIPGSSGFQASTGTSWGIWLTKRQP